MRIHHASSVAVLCVSFGRGDNLYITERGNNHIHGMPVCVRSRQMSALSNCKTCHCVVQYVLSFVLQFLINNFLFEKFIFGKLQIILYI